jgi:TRAP-type mannitol/chloroaromatic compound transport system permease large subunit
VTTARLVLAALYPGERCRGSAQREELLQGRGTRPPTLNQIFAGMMPFMAIQLVALALLYAFPGIGLWLPQVLYR